MKNNAGANKNTRARAGFTLVELLVVIVIIAALAGIGFPLANRMRSKAADGKCMEQMRSWSSIFARYAADNGGMLECRNWNSIGGSDPSAYVKYWTGGADESHAAGFRTLEKMRCCPALKGPAAKSGNGNSLTAYSMTDGSGIASTNAKAGIYNIAAIKNPSRFVILIETTGGASFIKTPGDYTGRVKPLTVAGQSRHEKGAVNLILGDYSVKTLDWKEIEKNIPAYTTF